MIRSAMLSLACACVLPGAAALAMPVTYFGQDGHLQDPLAAVKVTTASSLDGAPRHGLDAVVRAAVETGLGRAPATLVADTPPARPFGPAAPVPEPATLVLLGSGLLGLALMRGRIASVMSRRVLAASR